MKIEFKKRIKKNGRIKQKLIKMFSGKEGRVGREEEIKTIGIETKPPNVHGFVDQTQPNHEMFYVIIRQN